MNDMFQSKASKLLIVSIVVFIVWTIIHCIMMNGTLTDEVQNDYFPVADAMFNGHTPYHSYNDLAWEYPPLALIIMFIPRIFASSPFAYQIAFDIEMLLFAFVEFYIIYRFAEENKRNTCLIMTVNLILMGIMLINGSILERFDIVPAAICLVSVYLYHKEKYVPTFVLVAIGTLVKIYPALLFLVFIIPFLARKEWKTVGRYTAITAGVGLAVMAVFYILCSDQLMNFITYHSDRGIQIESMAGSFISLLSVLGATEVTSFISYGSCNIDGSVPNAVSPFIMPILVLAVLFLCFVQYKAEIKGKETLFTFSFLIILVFMVFNKVFSGQYIMWLVPMFVMLIASREWSDDDWIMSALMISISLMTMVIMAIPLLKMQTGPIILLFVRNILILALLVFSVRSFGLLDIFRPSGEDEQRDSII